MAINWQTGIKEIKEGGEATAQGLAGAGQALSQGMQSLGNAMGSYGATIQRGEQEKFDRTIGAIDKLGGVFKEIKQQQRVEEQDAQERVKFNNYLQDFNISLDNKKLENTQKQQSIAASEEQRVKQKQAEEQDKISSIDTLKAQFGIDFDETKHGNPSMYLNKLITARKDHRDQIASNVEVGKLGVMKGNLAVAQEEAGVKKANGEVKLVMDLQKSRQTSGLLGSAGANYNNVYSPTDDATRPIAAGIKKNYDEKFKPAVDSLKKQNQNLGNTLKMIDENFVGEGPLGAPSDKQIADLAVKTKELYGKNDNESKVKKRTIQMQLLGNMMQGRMEVIGPGAVTERESTIMQTLNNGGMPTGNEWRELINAEGIGPKMKAFYTEIYAQAQSDLNITAFLKVKNQNNVDQVANLKGMLAANEDFSFVEKDRFNSDVYGLVPQGSMKPEDLQNASRDFVVGSAFGDMAYTAHPRAISMDKKAEAVKNFDFNRIDEDYRGLENTLTTTQGKDALKAVRSQEKQQLAFAGVKEMYPQAPTAQAMQYPVGANEFGVAFNNNGIAPKSPASNFLTQGTAPKRTMYKRDQENKSQFIGAVLNNRGGQ